MQKSSFYLFFLFVLIALNSTLPLFAQTAQPNILFILSDDQGYGDLSLHGNDTIHTPVLDQLALQGARFSRFFVSPLCAPTRASFLTGRYHLRTGTYWVSRGTEDMQPEELTLAEILKENGYATGIFGKWHNGAHYPNSPNGQGFDESLGFSAGHLTNYFNTSLEHNGKTVPTKGFITDVLTDAALAFIEKNRSKPFFCYIPYNAPHSPFQVPDKYFDRYKKMGLDDKNAAVYALCENMDENIGRILQRLEQSGLAQNTIVVFATDNGPNGQRYNAGMKGIKGSVDEGGVRVPLFIRWPVKIKPDTEVKQLAAHIDLYPTLLEMAGISVPANVQLDGISLYSSMQGKTPVDRMLFTHVSRNEKLTANPGAVRTGKYRLVIDQHGKSLYDMEADPGQKNNLADKQPDVVQALYAAYTQWFKNVSVHVSTARFVPVGYNQAEVNLPAHEAVLAAGVQFKEKNGYAHDWLTGWENGSGKVYWDVSVETPGNYKIFALYNANADATGSSINVSGNKNQLQAKIMEPYQSPFIPSPDRVKRIEAFEKEWKPVEIGTMHLDQGKYKLWFSFISGKKAASSFELKGLQLVPQHEHTNR